MKKEPLQKPQQLELIDKNGVPQLNRERFLAWWEAFNGAADKWAFQDMYDRGLIDGRPT